MITQAQAHIYLCAQALRVVVLSHNEKNADFSSVSHISNAHRSLSSPGVLECSRPPSTIPVWLATYGRVSHAINLSQSIGYIHDPFLIEHHNWIYRLLHLCPLPIFRFPQQIIHAGSLRVILYLSSANIPMETRLLFGVGTCRLCARKLCFHSLTTIELVRLLLWRCCILAHCLLKLRRWRRPNNSKTIQCQESHEMWHWSLVATCVFQRTSSIIESSRESIA